MYDHLGGGGSGGMPSSDIFVFRLLYITSGAFLGTVVSVLGLLWFISIVECNRRIAV